MIDITMNEMLHRQYNPDGSDLRKLQLEILEVLKIVDGICRHNKIPYWLSSGTLLGAVRHEGFIPWDDDVDIEILRKDKKRFVDACNKELPSNYHIQNHSTELDYYINFMKVRDDSTDIGEKVRLGNLGEFSVNYKYKGVFIDVFCEEPCIPQLQKMSNWLIGKVFYLRYIKKTNRYLCRLISDGVYVLFASFRFLSSLFADKRILYHGFGSGFESYRKIENIFPLKEIVFEGERFLSPANSDKYLNDMFGDYMEIPTEKKRFGHHSNL